MKWQIPARLVRAMSGKVEVDVTKRILKRALFVTRSIASDGGIVVPEGINVRHFETNPVVLLMHGRGAEFPVIGRSLALKTVREGIESETQFADTELGREIAYLYGVNNDGEVYARGWSFGWDTTEMETWTLAHAKEWLGPDWDEDLVPPSARRWDEVWVALRSQLNEYSAVALGADKKALSRAYGEKGVRLAGELIADMDLTEAGRRLAVLETEDAAMRKRIDKLERELQALRRDGTSAAARGDADALLKEIEALTQVARAGRSG